MLISRHPSSAETLQLGEGTLLMDFDLDAALAGSNPLDFIASALMDDAKRIGTTCGATVFRAFAKEFNPEDGAHRLRTDGSTLLVDWRVTLSGTLMDVTPENMARLLPGDGGSKNQRVRLFAPRVQRTALPSVCWIGTAGHGLMVIELLHPLCVSGALLQIKPDSAGQMPFTFLAQSEQADDPALPVRIYWWKEDIPDASGFA